MTAANYQQIVSGKPHLDARIALQEAASSIHVRLVERKHWLTQPVTIEFVQTLASLRQDIEQSAKAFALSGDNNECARKMVELATIDKITTILKNG